MVVLDKKILFNRDSVKNLRLFQGNWRTLARLLGDICKVALLGCVAQPSEYCKRSCRDQLSGSLLCKTLHADPFIETDLIQMDDS